ncbi:CHASE [Musa troglodytarum]|nr:CHASE [Musa troglodytarum]
MRELKVQAESADVAKSEFLATVSHEIRTPMNSVLGMLQMLIDTDLDATQQDLAMTAQSSGKALIALINEVLDQAKIESGRLELEAVPFDLRDLLDNVLSFFSDKSQAKGIEMAVYVSERVPEVLIGDPGRLRQIITNLVGNSVKEGCRNSGDTKRHHCDPALSDFQGMRGLVADGRSIHARIIKYHLRRMGIHVDVVSNQDSALCIILDACNTSGRERFDLVLVDKDAWGEGEAISFPCLLLDCRQNGAAMPLGSLPNMFLVAIFQSPTEVHELKSAGYVDSLLKPLRPGMIAACLWKALGMEHKRQQFKGKSMPLQSLLSVKNILVVDDNAINCKVAAAVLEKFGATVTSADRGRRLLKCYNLHTILMLALWIFEATRQIRLMENIVNELIRSRDASLELYGNVVHWHIPILAVTADVIQATHEECLRCGMDDYVSKPFEAQQLYSSVAQFFESDMVDGMS